MKPGTRHRGALAGFVDYLLPPACAACGGSAVDEVRNGQGPVCQNCRLALPRVPQPACGRCGAPLGTGEAPSCLECVDWPAELVSARAVCLLESPARELVHALKYQGWRGVGDAMGAEMARTASPLERSSHYVVPIPTSARNLRRRGYNQAEVIAAAVAGSLDIPLLRCLKRSRQEGTQTALNPMQRRANVSGAFVTTEVCRETIRDHRILLVDDVITTGATILAAVRALLSASRVHVAACAFSRTVPISLDSLDHT